MPTTPSKTLIQRGKEAFDNLFAGKSLREAAGGDKVVSPNTTKPSTDYKNSHQYKMTKKAQESFDKPKPGKTSATKPAPMK